MATYAELFELRHNGALRQKVIVAITIAANKVRVEPATTTNHANRMVWAAGAYANAVGLSEQVWWAVIAANNTSEVSAILAATDELIQTNVDAVVDVLAGV